MNVDKMVKAARQPAVAELARRVAERVNHTNGGSGLINFASAESDRYDGSLVSVVEAVIVEIDDPDGYAGRFWNEIAKLIKRSGSADASPL